MKTAQRAVIVCIVALSALYAAKVQWGPSNWMDIVEADGRGYYAYLPAVFVYQDLNFSFYDSIEKKYPGHEYDYRVEHNGRTANKYFAGTAIVLSPFFLVAHAGEKILGGAADGYSRLYAIAINVAGLFYLFLGLFYLRKLLRLFGFSETRISFVLVLATFATNLFYYAAIEPAMSHVYSFAFICCFLYTLKKFFIAPSVRLMLISAALCGIIFLIRPVNILVLLLIPFLAGSGQSLKNGFDFFRRNAFSGVAALAIFVGIICIQGLIYRVQTGSFLVDSYGEESFNWSRPQMINFLFSYKKGLFVYTPIALLSLLGLIRLYRVNRFRFLMMSSFLLILLYVLSSWWNWWYGGSFSSRVCVEFYALAALLQCYSFDLMKARWLKRSYAALLLCCLLLCQVQVHQYRYFYIHWEEMNKDRYWNVFMRLDLLMQKKNPNADLLD